MFLLFLFYSLHLILFYFVLEIIYVLQPCILYWQHPCLHKTYIMAYQSLHFKPYVLHSFFSEKILLINVQLQVFFIIREEREYSKYFLAIATV